MECVINLTEYSVREVVELEPVAVTVQVCQLQPIWSTPRPIRESYRGQSAGATILHASPSLPPSL